MNIFIICFITNNENILKLIARYNKLALKLVSLLICSFKFLEILICLPILYLN